MEETPSRSVPKVVTTADARKGFADLLEFVQSTGGSVAIRRYTTVVAHLVPEPPADDAPAYSLAQVLQALDADDFRTEPGRISVATACELLERGITRIEDWQALAWTNRANLDNVTPNPLLDTTFQSHTVRALPQRTMTVQEVIDWCLLGADTAAALEESGADVHAWACNWPAITDAIRRARRRTGRSVDGPDLGEVIIQAARSGMRPKGLPKQIERKMIYDGLAGRQLAHAIGADPIPTDLLTDRRFVAADELAAYRTDDIPRQEAFQLLRSGISHEIWRRYLAIGISTVADVLAWHGRPIPIPLLERAHKDGIPAGEWERILRVIPFRDGSKGPGFGATGELPLRIVRRGLDHQVDLQEWDARWESGFLKTWLRWTGLTESEAAEAVYAFATEGIRPQDVYLMWKWKLLPLQMPSVNAPARPWQWYLEQASSLVAEGITGAWVRQIGTSDRAAKDAFALEKMTLEQVRRIRSYNPTWEEMAWLRHLRLPDPAAWIAMLERRERAQAMVDDFAGSFLASTGQQHLCRELGRRGHLAPARGDRVATAVAQCLHGRSPSGRFHVDHADALAAFVVANGPILLEHDCRIAVADFCAAYGTLRHAVAETAPPGARPAYPWNPPAC
ncbi:hypothetical protein OIE61_44325 [Streptomyces sp. NBC_01762]|uniref:hypothetical protein n=1 Tax=Streptomyces sp. NBC_01762 TaxID=2975933 RepID=UPI002DDB08C2|nr:hypothetical protein [Streptomyces sp. NBC_01762]WSC42567.1 hypothetical protein OIE61_00150 [Streptomyces sp. NBC_01762]WSC50286.1 hypothetical protein OIE61_44325 [Streptomyces sp. NBC_01762]